MKNVTSERRRNLGVAISLAVLTVSLSLAVYFGGIWFQPLLRVRQLAETILRNTYNPFNETLTSYSLNSVSAVVWDYRGIDTIFETTVLLASVLGLTILLGENKARGSGFSSGMGLLPRFTTRITLLITALIAVSTAVHGHLTPGGGFQAGAMLTVVVVLLIPVFSIRAAYLHGLRRDVLLKLRYVILLLLVLIVLSPILTIPFTGNAYIMQNQVKSDSSFSMPSWLFDTPLGGSIFFYNLVEMFAVALAISYALLLLLEYEAGGTP